MKYLLNLPLGAAALAQAWFASLVLMSAPWAGWSDGPSRGAMALVMLEAAACCWGLLMLAMVAAAFSDVFDWLPVGRRWLRRMLVVVASLLIVVLALTCVGVAIEGSAAVGGGDAANLGTLVRVGAPLVAVLLPFILAGWLAWMIDAPPRLRDAAVPRGIGLGGLAALLLVGGPLGTSMLAGAVRDERETAARYRQADAEREATASAYFARLTDVSPLSSWGAYATDALDRKERREAALRGLAARPTLEADLAKDLVSRNRYDSFARDSDIAFLLVARVQFAPSAALEAPLRTAMSRIAAEMRKASFGDKWTGDSDTLDSYISTGFAERLAASLIIAKRMADAGVDLRDALGELQSTAIAAYPKTKSAETYQRDVAAADQYIEAALAARRK